jgi:hypothetical protein
MKRIVSSLALAAGMLASSAFAATTTYTAVLQGRVEAPPNLSPGWGEATIVIDDVANTLQLDMTFGGLLGTTTDAHIHCCTASPLTGTAGVATPLDGFTLGVSAGAYSQVFDLMDAGTYTGAFITANGGTVMGARDALLTGFIDHTAYLNVHSTVFPGGEIRDFAVPLPVPEPETYAMMLAGLAAVGFLARKKQA